MDFAKASMMTLMSALVVILSVVGTSAQSEAAAPSPTSPAAAISPSIVSACLAIVVALVLFGSALKA